MQRSNMFAPLALLLAAPVAWAIPDANGNLVDPAPDVADDSAMKARLNYNIGFEKFEQAQKLEMSAGALQGAKAREAREGALAGFADARERFRTAVGADPNLKEAWNLIGYTSRRLGDYEESLAAYERALALNPDYPEAIEYRAELFLLTGRLDEVMQAYAALAKNSPSYAGALKASIGDWLARKEAAPGVDAARRNAFAAWFASL